MSEKVLEEKIENYWEEKDSLNLQIMIYALT